MPLAILIIALLFGVKGLTAKKDKTMWYAFAVIAAIAAGLMHFADNAA
jgi:hypothetical protein